MSETDAGNGTDIDRAVSHLMSIELSGFEEMLDATLECRIGLMRQKTSDGYTIQEALMGKSIHMTPVLLTQTEIQVMRTRGGYAYIADRRQMANSTIPIVRDSLERIGIAKDLKALGITVGTRKDKFGKFHIVFTPIP